MIDVTIRNFLDSDLEIFREKQPGLVFLDSKCEYENEFPIEVVKS